MSPWAGWFWTFVLLCVMALIPRSVYRTVVWLIVFPFLFGALLVVL